MYPSFKVIVFVLIGSSHYEVEGCGGSSSGGCGPEDSSIAQGRPLYIILLFVYAKKGTMHTFISFKHKRIRDAPVVTCEWAASGLSCLKGAVTRNSDLLGSHKMPVKRNIKITA